MILQARALFGVFCMTWQKKIKKWAWCGLGAGLVKAWCRLGAGLIWQILYPKKLAHPVWFHGSCCWLFGVSHISSYRSCSWTTVGLLYVPTTMLSVLFSLLVYYSLQHQWKLWEKGIPIQGSYSTKKVKLVQKEK